MSSDTKIHQDLTEAVSVASLYGRASELSKIWQWMVQDRCRLISILGMGGIGKTTLATKLVEQVLGEREQDAQMNTLSPNSAFEVVIWKSLDDAPPLRILLSQLIAFLSKRVEIILPEADGISVSALLEYLRHHRCLLVLDNWESLFKGGNRVGCYRDGYEDYGELLKRIAQTNHLSCLLITSREHPRELHRLESATTATHCLRLSGLPTSVGQASLQNIGDFSGADADWHGFVEYYGGNPLLLKIIARFIQDYTGGDLAEFMVYLKQGQCLVDEIQDVLQQQIERLSSLEHQVMSWFASGCNGRSLATLRAEMIPSVTLGELLATVDSLRQRSLLNQYTTNGNKENLFCLSPVVRDYALSQFVQPD